MRAKILFILVMLDAMFSGCSKDEDSKGREDKGSSTSQDIVSVNGWWDIEKVKVGGTWTNPTTYYSGGRLLFTDEKYCRILDREGMIYRVKDKTIECFNVKNFDSMCYSIEIIGQSAASMTVKMTNVENGVVREYLLKKNAQKSLFVKNPATYLEGKWRVVDGDWFETIVFENGEDVEDVYAIFYDKGGKPVSGYYYYKEKEFLSSINFDYYPEGQTGNIENLYERVYISIETITPAESPKTFRLTYYYHPSRRTYVCNRE